MEKTFNKLFLIGLMMCSGAVMRPAAAPKQNYNLHVMTEELYNSLPNKEQTMIIDQLIEPYKIVEPPRAWTGVAENNRGQEYSYPYDQVQKAYAGAIENDWAWALAPLKKYTKCAELCLAASKGREKVVMVLVANETDIDSINLAFCEAASSGHENIARLLLEKGANVNVQLDKKHQPVLHAAATKGHANIVKLLVEAGINTDTVNEVEQTALACAAFAYRDNMIDYETPQYVQTIPPMLINGYRNQLARQYRKRECEPLSEQELSNFGHLNSLPPEVMAYIIQYLSDFDLINMALVAKGCKKLSYDEMNKRLPHIKAKKFTAFILPALKLVENSRGTNQTILATLFKQELRKGFETTD